jgi:hypothetical protein
MFPSRPLMRIAIFAAIGLVAMTTILHAQSDDDDDEDAMDYAPLVPTGNSMRFGLRYVGGPKVTFHNVGTISGPTVLPSFFDLSTNQYADGYVGADTRTDSNGHPANDGLTNTWKVNFPSQITSDGNVAYHIYSTTAMPDGQSVQASNALAEGWELQMGHSLGRIARKVDVSIVAGFTLNSFNSRRSSGIQSQLTTLTDVYSLNGQIPPENFPATQPTPATTTIYDSNGQPVKSVSGDQSQLLASTPTRTIVNSTTNANGTTSPTTTEVQGNWQIKGAYYTFRLGPMFQFPVTERLKLNLDFGAAAVLVGSTYTSNEMALVANVVTLVTNSQVKTHTVLLPAWYIDADAEYWLTERAGFYLGASYQKCQSFNQQLAGESATIDMSSTSGLTSGITLRF